MAIKERNDQINETTTLWQDYENGLAYQSSTGISKKIPKFVKFYEGDQWATPTKNTKNLPRPVVNIIKMICRNKKSAILSTPVKIIYRAEDEMADVEKFNNFADYIQKEIGQESLDKKAINDGVIKGSYFYHYYWDSEAKGKDGAKEGGLRCEIIDPLNIFFSDPTQLDEQKQEWILIASRENVKSVRAKCDSDVDIETIVSDEADNKYGVIEQEGDKLCTVLTRYFRKDGEVFCEKATKSVIVNKPFAITPDLETAGRELGFEEDTPDNVEEDAPNNATPDKPEDKSLIPEQTKAFLYPIVVGNYEIKEKCIYGLGEVEGLIPNQKAINFNIAMALLNSQEMAWGKYVVHPNALKGQVITNEPGQVIVDYSGTQNGVRKMTEQVISGQPLQIIDTITQLTRVVTGSTEVMTGETLGAGMSGAAIAQLQAQASQPIEELKDSFWLVKEKQGKVLAQFFKLYYTSKEFTYMASPSEIEKSQLPNTEAPQMTNTTEGEEIQMTDVFNSDDYKGTEFSIVVEATSGTKASAAGDINALDVLLAKGNISIKTYLKAYPKDALSNRTEILKGIEEDEQSQIAELTKQLQQAQEQNIELAKVVEQQKETVDKVVAVIKENNELKTLIANLYSEASAKIKAANQQTQIGNAKLAETTKDASDMAQAIYNNMQKGGNPNVMPQV